MLKHYFKIATRSILNDKGYSIINMIGLSVAIACCFLLIFWIKFELSYEECYPKANHIYQLMVEEERTGGRHYAATIHQDLTSMLKETFPQIEAATVMHQQELPFTDIEKNDKTDAVLVVETKVHEDFLHMFDLKYIEGSAQNVIKKRGAVITDEMAYKLFGKQSAIGKTITFESGFVKHTIEAVVELPANTDIRFDLLQISQRIFGEHFIMLKKGQKVTPAFKEQLADFLSAQGNNDNKLRLLAIKDIHLHAPEGIQPKAAGRLNQIHLFAFAALLILLVAIINYVNTSIARSLNRMKEVGVRKVTGAEKKQLIERFLLESYILSFVSVIFAFFLTQLLFPSFSEVMGHKIKFGYDWMTFAIALIVGVLVSVMSGGYAAFYLSSLNPIYILRGTSKTGSKEMLRKVLIGLQFFLSIAILICTLIIYKQIHSIFNADTGIDRKNMLVLKTNLWYNAENFFEVIKKENPHIIDATIANSPPYNAQWGYSGVSWEESDETVNEIEFYQITCDHHYANTFGLEMVSGEFIPPGLTWWQFAEANSSSIVINESFQQMMGVDNPIGITVTYGPHGRRHKGKIIGVVKNFNFKPLRTKITPLIISFNPEASTIVFIKTTGKHKQQTLNHVLSRYKKMMPSNMPVIYYTADEDYKKMYETELRTASMLSIFSVISFFLSLMGVISMTSFMIEKRTKEIAIRKINGAGINEVILLFIRDIASIALIASAIAIPICYAIMHNWLQHYVYRTTLSWWIFVVIPLFILFTTCIIIAVQVYMAARKNPVESLRSE